MKMKKYIIVIILFFVNYLHSQNGCSMTNPPPKPRNLTLRGGPQCSIESSYNILNNPNSNNIKTIRIMWHVIRKDDKSGSFNGTDLSISNFFNDVANNINYRLSNNQLPSPNKGSSLVNDTKLRVKHSIKFWNSTSAFNIFNNGTIEPQDVFIANYIKSMSSPLTFFEKNNYLHIIIMPKITKPITGGMASGFYDKNWIRFAGIDYEYNDIKSPNYQNKYNTVVISHAGHVLHEMGHNLGLFHNFDNQQDNCVDNDLTNGSPPTKGSSNNHMDYVGSWVATCYSECQIYNMHFGLYNNLGGLADLIVEDFCNIDALEQLITISNTQNIVYNGSKFIKSNIVVNGSLTFNCDVSMPKNSSIQVNNKLFLLESKIYSYCGKMWYGVIIENNGYVNIDKGIAENCQILVKSGGTLHLTGNLDLKNANITIESGGYLCIDNNAKINFINSTSYVDLKSGFLYGIKPGIGITSSSSCKTIAGNTNGNGNIYTNSNFCFIQNEYITSSRIVSSCNDIYIGRSVTSSKPIGNVTIDNSILLLNPKNSVTFTEGFEIINNAELEIKF